MTINGRNIDIPIVRHEDIANGGEIVFEMSEKVEAWGNGLLVRFSHLQFSPLFCLMIVPLSQSEKIGYIRKNGKREPGRSLSHMQYMSNCEYDSEW